MGRVVRFGSIVNFHAAVIAAEIRTTIRRDSGQTAEDYRHLKYVFWAQDGAMLNIDALADEVPGKDVAKLVLERPGHDIAICLREMIVSSYRNPAGYNKHEHVHVALPVHGYELESATCKCKGCPG